MGERAGPTYLNAVMEWQTSRSPQELLNEIHEVEAKLGRVRQEHWGPRPIDIDILAWDDQQIDEPDLQIPHPQCWLRRFVLDPWAEIAPDWVHPNYRETVHERVAVLTARPLRIVVRHQDPQWRAIVRRQLKSEYSPSEMEVIEEAAAGRARFSGRTALESAKSSMTPSTPAVTFCCDPVTHQPAAILSTDPAIAAQEALVIAGAMFDQPVPVQQG